ncbi:MAG: tetratricopeptide repeat protein [Victivallales bacterium]|nr:tetratricopeptide repeat protein [Victivallales bacterium]
MKYRIKKRLFVYLLPPLAAFIVRMLLFICWWDSPLRWYSSISGLDMKTVLETGAWLYNGKTIFTLYKGMLAAIMFLNGGGQSPESIVIIQLLGGIIIALLTAWCALRIWGNMYWSMASGLLAALYAPAMMYQVTTLKESFLLFFALLSLAAVLWAHKLRFSPYVLWICGIFLALPCICRITAIPFCGLAALWIMACLYKKIKIINKTFINHSTFLALGMLTVFIPVSVANGFLTNGTYYLPLQSPVSYVFRLGSITAPQSLNLPPPGNDAIADPLPASGTVLNGNFAINLFRKIPQVFSASEIPNNVNYYFLKYKIFPLQYLVGPLLLFPLAVTALLLLLLNRGILHRESILFVFAIAYMLPLCVFVPLARYRLVLTPIFCMLAPYPFFIAFRAWNRNKRIAIILPLLAWIMILMANLPLHNFLRASDFVSWGKALEFQTGKAAAALPWFLHGYQMAPDKQMTVINLADALLKLSKPQEAIRILLPAYRKFPENVAYQYYLGIAFLHTGNARNAAYLFSRIKPAAMGELQIQYYYYYGESLRVQGQKTAAASLFRKALEAGPNPARRALIEKSLGACNGKKQ